MTDIETKIEVEAEDFTEELSDEALDREGALVCHGCAGTALPPSACAGARQGPS